MSHLARTAMAEARELRRQEPDVVNGPEFE